MLMFNCHHRTVTVNTVLTDQEEALDIAQELVDTIISTYIPLLGDAITFQEVETIGISNPLVTATIIADTAGALAEQLVSLRSAPVIKLGTGLRGRSYNGRMFFMPPTEQQQSGGVLGATPQANIQLVVTAIRRLSTQPSTNVYDMTVYSPTLTGEGPVVDNLVTVWSTNNTLGSQRGRQTVV